MNFDIIPELKWELGYLRHRHDGAGDLPFGISVVAVALTIQVRSEG
jgi:hypothetical protein